MTNEKAEQPQVVFSRYLDLGSPRAVGEQLAQYGTSWTSARGAAAQTACIVLATQQLESTIKRLDRAANRLTVASIVLAVVSLAVAVIGLFTT